MAPKLLTQNIATTATSLTVQSVIDAPGDVYCGVFTDSQTVIAERILSQNYPSTSNVYRNISTVVLSPLLGLTEYQVYCLTVSAKRRVQMSTEKLLATRQTATTACCQQVLVTMNSVTYVENEAAIDALRIELTSLPKVALEIALVCSDTVSNASSMDSGYFFPSTFRVDSASTSSILRASLQPRLASSLLCRVTLSGTSAQDYTVVYQSTMQDNRTRTGTTGDDDDGVAVTLLRSDEEPATPQLASATFASDGQALLISFDTPTNRGGMSTLFECDKLFEFRCAATAQCRWQDNSAVVAQFTGDLSDCAEPSDNLSLRSSAAIKARCLYYDVAYCVSTLLPAWSAASTSATVLIAAPSSVTVPVVSISSATVIGECDPLLLDISASSGSGGRVWRNLSFVVGSGLSGAVGANVTAIQTFLDAVSAAKPSTVIIPYDMLSKDYTYDFNIQVCNFLGGCGSGRRSVLVLSELLPFTSLPGLPYRTTLRKTTLSVKSNAYISQCDGDTSVLGLAYQWNIYRRPTGVQV